MLLDGSVKGLTGLCSPRLRRRPLFLSWLHGHSLPPCIVTEMGLARTGGWRRENLEVKERRTHSCLLSHLVPSLGCGSSQLHLCACQQTCTLQRHGEEQDIGCLSLQVSYKGSAALCSQPNTHCPLSVPFIRERPSACSRSKDCNYIPWAPATVLT